MGPEVREGQEQQSREEQPSDDVPIPAIYCSPRSTKVTPSADGTGSFEAASGGAASVGDGSSAKGQGNSGAIPAQGEGHGVTRNGPMTQGAMSAASSAQRRDAPGAPASLDPRADRDAHLSAGGAAGSRGRGPVRFATSADEMISTMSSAERKLCRRGVEACSRKPVELYGVHDGVDVMVLERGSGEEVLTAVGLSTTALFEELTPAMIRSSATIEKAVKEIRRLNPSYLSCVHRIT